ncbi:hypothetical protein SLA2020_292610 [Shorea laevis]
MAIVQHKAFVQFKLDEWIWIYSTDVLHSTSSGYEVLSSQFQSEDTTTFKRVWNKDIPSKVSAFVWQLIQNRILTKDNLQKREALKDANDKSCGFCGFHLENFRSSFPKLQYGYTIMGSML